jgi:hypothetical protein
MDAELDALRGLFWNALAQIEQCLGASTRQAHIYTHNGNNVPSSSADIKAAVPYK